MFADAGHIVPQLIIYSWRLKTAAKDREFRRCATHDGLLSVQSVQQIKVQPQSIAMNICTVNGLELARPHWT